MKGIRPEGKCPVCKGPFKWDNKKGFVCADHLTSPKRYLIDLYFKGERIRRGTTLNGKTLRSFADAHALLRQAEREIEAYTFDPDRWKSKKKFEYQFSSIIWKWYEEKEQLMKQGKRAPGYVPKLRTYINHYYEPYFKTEDVREIRSCKHFVMHLPSRLSPKYQKNISDALRGFFNWLKEERIISQTPVFPVIEVPEHEPTTVFKETSMQYLELVEQDHKSVFTFLLVQGARPAEVAALMGDCINGDTVTYKRGFSGRKFVEYTKTKKIRHNYIFPMVQAILPKVFPKQYVFTHGKSGRPYSGDYLNKIHRRTLAKFNEKYGSELKIELYELCKHSFGTQFINEYPEHESMLQKHFGHSRREMVQRYAKLKVVDAFRKLDKVKQIRPHDEAASE